MANVSIEVEEAYAAYALALGTVVHSSNSFHETLARLYWHLVGGDLRTSNAVWHSSQNDRAQRQMLRAALGSKPEHLWERRLPNARKDLEWLITQAEKASNQRNDAVHAPCLFSFEAREVVAIPFSLNQRALNLRNKKLIKEFELYSGVFGMLNTFALQASMALGSNGASWPDRPHLPARTASMK